MKTETIIKTFKEAHKRGELPVIIKETGLPRSWAYKVANGRIKSICSKRADVLREYFEQEQAA